MASVQDDQHPPGWVQGCKRTAAVDDPQVFHMDVTVGREQQGQGRGFEHPLESELFRITCPESALSALCSLPVIF
jgi:hypothetical protein